MVGNENPRQETWEGVPDFIFGECRLDYINFARRLFSESHLTQEMATKPELQVSLLGRFTGHLFAQLCPPFSYSDPLAST